MEMPNGYDLRITTEIEIQDTEDKHDKYYASVANA